MLLQRQIAVFVDAGKVQLVLQELQEVRGQFLFTWRTEADRQCDAWIHCHALMGVLRRQVQQVAALGDPLLRMVKLLEYTQRRVVDQFKILLIADAPAPRARAL